MKLSISPPPFAGAPVVVLIAGLGGSGNYWLPQLAVLGQEYQVVCYDQRGTGNNPDPLPEDYTLAHMADELALALAGAGIARYCVVGHALGALVGLRLAIDKPDALTALVCVNGWPLNAHTRRCFDVRERLLHAGGAQAWVEAQPLFLYPADWMAARAPRLEAEDALALAHFQGKANLLRRLHALKQADFSRHAARVRCPPCRLSVPPTICWCRPSAPLNCTPPSRTLAKRSCARAGMPATLPRRTPLTLCC